MTGIYLADCNACCDMVETSDADYAAEWAEGHAVNTGHRAVITYLEDSP